MSQEQPLHNPALAPRRPRQISIAKLRTARGLSLIGLPELIGLAGAVLIAILTIFAYFYFYLPAQSRLTTLQLERDRLQAFLRTSQSNLQENTTVRQQVDEITGSMSDFENNWLANSSSGRMSLYATLNNLIKSNGLRNTAGPTYTPLEPIGSKGRYNRLPVLKSRATQSGKPSIPALLSALRLRARTRACGALSERLKAAGNS